MTASPNIPAKGLDGITVASTKLSKVEGDIGRLTYCGYDIKDLALNATFEEIVYLLWHLRLPTQAEMNAFKTQLSENMALPPELCRLMKSLPTQTHPMAALRSIVSLAGMYDPLAEDNSLAANRKKALTLTARMPTMIAAWGRIREGKEPIGPRDDLSIAGNFLYMLDGKEPDPVAVRAIDRYLILLTEHGMNASTFTARVVTSTDGDMYSAIVAAIGSLKGPKHGGANEQAMRLFFEVEDSGLGVEEWYKQARAAGRRFAGIGHRIYKALDPRAGILRDDARALAQTSGNTLWFDIAYKIEELTRADSYFVERNLYPNVDYYSAIVLYTLGSPTDMFTPLFALSRIAGWTAHIIEQWEDNRLIRPESEYIGPMGLSVIPIEQRG
jgi:citrate synthase